MNRWHRKKFNSVSAIVDRLELAAKPSKVECSRNEHSVRSYTQESYPEQRQQSQLDNKRTKTPTDCLCEVENKIGITSKNRSKATTVQIHSNTAEGKTEEERRKVQPDDHFDQRNDENTASTEDVIWTQSAKDYGHSVGSEEDHDIEYVSVAAITRPVPVLKHCRPEYQQHLPASSTVQRLLQSPEYADFNDAVLLESEFVHTCDPASIPSDTATATTASQCDLTATATSYVHLAVTSRYLVMTRDQPAGGATGARQPRTELASVVPLNWVRLEVAAGATTSSSSSSSSTTTSSSSSTTSSSSYTLSLHKGPAPPQYFRLTGPQPLQPLWKLWLERLAFLNGASE